MRSGQNHGTHLEKSGTSFGLAWLTKQARSAWPYRVGLTQVQGWPGIVPSWPSCLGLQTCTRTWGQGQTGRIWARGEAHRCSGRVGQGRTQDALNVQVARGMGGGSRAGTCVGLWGYPSWCCVGCQAVCLGSHAGLIFHRCFGNFLGRLYRPHVDPHSGGWPQILCHVADDVNANSVVIKIPIIKSIEPMADIKINKSSHEI